MLGTGSLAPMGETHQAETETPSTLPAGTVTPAVSKVTSAGMRAEPSHMYSPPDPLIPPPMSTPSLVSVKSRLTGMPSGLVTASTGAAEARSQPNQVCSDAVAPKVDGVVSVVVKSVVQVR